MSTYDDYLALAKPAQGDTSWTTEVNENWDTIGLARCAERVYEVSPTWTPGALYPDGTPNKQRLFATIQEAIDAGESDFGDATGFVVKVWPGTYDEDLLIQRPCSIVNAAGLSYFDTPAGAVRIRSDGTITPTITIKHWDANVQKVGLFGLMLDNSYSTTNGTEITSAPYLIDVQTKGGAESWAASPSRVDVRGCGFICQTWGQDNGWEAAVKVSGYWDFRMVDTQAMGLTYGGGNDDGFFRYLFDVLGDAASTKAVLKAVRCDFHNFTPTSGTPPTQYTFYERGYAQVLLKFCSVLQTSAASRGTTGSGNYSEGFEFDTPDDADLLNSFGNQFAIR